MEKAEAKIKLGHSNAIPPHASADNKNSTEKDLKLGAYVEGTTLHGLNHVCVADTSRVRRVVWLLLLLGMFTCYLIVATYSFVRYYR